MDPRKWQHQSPKKKWKKWSTKVPWIYLCSCIKVYFQAVFVQEIQKRSCTWSKWHNASRSAPKCNETTLFAVLCSPNLSKQRCAAIQFDALALRCVLGRDFQTASYHRWAPQALGEHSGPTLKGLYVSFWAILWPDRKSRKKICGCPISCAFLELAAYGKCLSRLCLSLCNFG